MKGLRSLGYFLRRVCPMSWPATVFSLCSIILKAATPMVTLLLSAQLLQSLIAHEQVERIIYFIFILVAFEAGSNLLQALLRNRFATLMEQLKDRFTLYIGRKLMEMHYGSLESAAVQDLKQQALLPILQWGNFEFIFENFLPAAVGGLITIVTSIFLLAEYKLWLVVPLLITVLLQLCVSALKNKRFQQVMMRVGLMDRKVGYYDSVSSDFSLGKDIRISRIDRMLMKKIKALNDNELKEFSQLFSHTARMDIWGTLVLQIQIYFVYLIAVIDLYWKLLQVDAFFRVTGLFINFGNALFQLINAFVDLRTRSRFLEKFMEFDRMAVAPPSAGSSCCMEPPQVELENVSFAYPGGKEILSDISFTIPAGKSVALVGVNGSGKSTIAKLLSGFLSPTSGRILINDQVLDRDNRQVLSSVYQDFQIFAFTVKENVETAYAGQNSTDGVLMKVGLDDVIETMPQGADTYVYKLFELAGREFSYGQAQKLATARALYKDTGMILLDEPTSAFDAKAEYEIFQEYQRLIKGKTALLISHRLWSCKFCDEIYVLSGRKIVEHGSHQELMEIEDGFYRNLFLTQGEYYAGSC